jgi:hypothetical protein
MVGRMAMLPVISSRLGVKMSQNKRVLILSGALLLLLVVGIVTAIVLANRPFAEYDIVSPTALPQFDPFIATQTAQPSPTLNPTTAMTVLPSTTTIESAACGWMWATQINPELSAQVQQQLMQVLVTVDSVEARAEAFGENCLNADGSVRYFATMQTDFRVMVQISSLPLNDLPAAEVIVAPIMLDILRVLADYPVGQTPGPMPGQISIEFPAGNKPYWLAVDYNTAMDALDQNLTGNDLLDALGGLRL